MAASPDPVITPALSGLSHVRHGFFGRKGGVSGGIYQALNCGPGSKDDPNHIRENRRIVAGEMGVDDAALSSLYQIHSAHVRVVCEPIDPMNRPQADAMVTDRSGLALGVLTADCAPVLFADHQAGVIGAAHAGWRGAAAGVLANTAAAMETLGAERHRITAVLGPCIRQESYEVGEDMRRAVLSDNDADHRFQPGKTPGKYQFDLAGFVLDRLGELGLGTISDTGQDTYALEEEFFSYRRATHRGEADYGRAVSVICLQE